MIELAEYKQVKISFNLMDTSKENLLAGKIKQTEFKA